MNSGIAVAIRAARRADAEAVARIYNYFVRGTVATFEERIVSAAEMSDRLAEVQGASFPWLIAEDAGEVVGYAYAAAWKARSAYRFSAEVSVYVGHGRARRGIGSSLYRELLPRLQERGIHVAVGVIGLPNPASIGLHEKFGFRKAAHLREVGFKFDRWIDVGYWQKIL